MLTVVGTIKVKDNAIGLVKSRLLSLVEPSRGETGCIRYSLYQDIHTPSLLVVYEEWENESALDAHMDTQHFRECFSAIKGLYEVEVHRLIALS